MIQTVRSISITYPTQHNKLFRVSFANVITMTSIESDTVISPPEVNYIISISINSIVCPFTVLLNVLVILVIKKRPRLRTNSNILLACLAVTDALTGLFGQPLYVLWRIFLLFGFSNSEILENVCVCVMTTLSSASYLHLMLVTFERLVAIKYAMRYSNVVTHNKLKIAVLAIWIISFVCGTLCVLKMYLALNYIGSLISISCIVLVGFAYVTLYHETRRRRRKIKTQQLPQEEVERSTKENKALKTTVFSVVSAVIVSLLPAGFCLIGSATDLFDTCPIDESIWQTCSVLNSFVNPLIYCWRQNEMRKLVFRIVK